MKTGEEKLRKSINFAVKNPQYFDYSETFLELKHVLKAYENATLVKDWERAYDLSIVLVDVSQRLETIAQAMLND